MSTQIARPGPDRRPIATHRPCARPVGLSLLALVVLAASAHASEAIESFTTSSSDARSRRPPGPHDVLHARRTRRTRGGGKCHLQGPRGDFRKPQRDHPLHLLGLRSRPVPAKLPGGPDHRIRELQRQPGLPARHRAPVHPRTGRRARRRCWRSSCRNSDIPIDMPVTVRTGTDYGLRSRSPGHHPVHPLAGCQA